MTRDLALRPLVVEDAPFLASLQTDPVFAAHAGWGRTTETADGEGWWRQSIAVPDPLLLRLLAVTVDGPVGYVDLHGQDPHVRELGYAIGPSSLWGHGLATEAARAGILWGFERLQLDRIWAEAVAANIASVRVLEKVGMHPHRPRRRRIVPRCAVALREVRDSSPGLCQVTAKKQTRNVITATVARTIIAST